MLQDSDPIRQRIQEIAARTPYAEAAVYWVWDSVRTFADSSPISVQIEPIEFCWRMRDRSLALFGAAAQQQLEEWGVKTTEDFGHIIAALMAGGLIDGPPSADISDAFTGIFEFDDAFDVSASAERYQFTIATSLVVTTVAAFYSAGSRSSIPYGGVLSVFSAWCATIGGFCLCASVTANQGRGAMLLLGLLFAGSGIAAFCAIVLH